MDEKQSVPVSENEQFRADQARLNELVFNDELDWSERCFGSGTIMDYRMT